jgi:hypothetical protein
MSAKMRSITIPEPTFPTIYCQLTEENEMLLSLMSSVVQRDVRSKRFDRNQETSSSSHYSYDEF